LLSLSILVVLYPADVLFSQFWCDSAANVE
jgi:hypothetical protein